MITLADARVSRLARIAGVCSTSVEFADLLNDGTREMMDRGNFWGTIKILQACVYDDCLVWPRSVGTVLALNRCGHSVPPKNQWYSFNDVLPEYVHHWNRHGRHLCDGMTALADTDTTCVLQQPPCNQNRFIRFYPSCEADVDKTITVFGIDGNGLPLRSLRADGTYEDGAIMVLTLPFVESTFLMRKVTRIIKDKTQMPVYAYYWDSTTMTSMGVYEPNERNPEYRSNRIRGQWTGNCCGPKQISALVKLNFIPVEAETDLVLVDDIDALGLAIQSVKLSDAYDSEGAESMMARAVHRANLTLRNKFPIDQTVARVHYQGTAHLNRINIGMQ